MPELGASVWAASALTLILGALFARGRARYNALPAIRAASRGDGHDLPDCMVVIPARNEEALIGRAVRSLPPDTVIVVDDHSVDRTAEKAREAGAGVLAAPDLPRKGLGKPNACAFGARALESRWVLFTDADTWFEPGFLDAAVAWAETNRPAVLSIYLDPELRGLAENTLVPYLRALTFAGFGMTSESRGLFRGQCLLVRREAYAFIGGHNAVLTRLLEDIHLAMAAERHRLKAAIARAPGLGHIRLYQHYLGIRSGIERDAFRFMTPGPGAGVAALLAVLGGALWLPILIWLLYDARWIAAVLFAFAPSVVLCPWYPKRRNSLLAPLALYWILPAAAAGALTALFGRSVEWKGRKIRAVS